MAQALHARDVGTDPTGMTGFLPHSVAATLAVLAFPSAILFSMLLLTEPNPPVILCSLLSLALSSLASIIGARLWQKHPKSKDVSFGDLMIWSWFSRRRAEVRLHRGTAALGLDRRGSPIGVLDLSREEQLRVLHELNEALESKDPYTRGHSKRVERHVFRMGNAMGLSIHEIEDLRLAAVLHDVGKIRIPDHILRKPAKLTAEEYRVMQDHSSVGAWMLSYVGNQDVIEAVRYHHERWDGHGYPDGVAGTDIPLFARMIAVADTYDAITSTRSYRARAARDHGLKELKTVSGSQLDPMCVEIFTSSLPAPVPVAAVLYLLPFGLKRAAREIGAASRRAGLQTIASGVGAASAAVIITTPVVAPALGARPAAVERAVGSEASGVQEAIIDDQQEPAVAADDNDGGGSDEATGDDPIEVEDNSVPGARTARSIAPLELDPLAVIVPATAADTGIGAGTTADAQPVTGDPGSGGSGVTNGDSSGNPGTGSGGATNNGNGRQNESGPSPGAGAGQGGQSGNSNPGSPDKSNAGGNGKGGGGGGNPDSAPSDNGNAGGNGGNPSTTPPSSNAGGNGGNPDPASPNNGNAGGNGGNPGGNANSGGNADPGGNGNGGGNSDKAPSATKSGGNSTDASPPTSNAGGNGNGGGKDKD